MATWLGNNVTVTGANVARIRIETQVVGQDVAGNYSTINYQVYIDFFGCDAQLDGGWVQSSAAVHYNNGGRVYNYAGNFSNHSVTMNTGTFAIGHDANGNGSYSMNAHITIFSSGVSTASNSESLPRIAQAPTFSVLSADTIKPTAARLGADLSSYGHGTSGTLEMFHRLLGSPTWISDGQQGDVVGANYWTPTGLKPAKTYQYICNCTNNNGDLAQTGIQTFKTQPVSGMIAVMKGLF